ncbi:MAG TPA: tripartite tricarboxylate transporter substrate binding protein [Pseudolabrys sp.]|jgi:tripartite-type tricarboxylate transporter receptor subunit TctC
MTVLKQFCSSAIAACLVLAAGAASADEAYPTRPVRLIVGFAAGSTADVGARILSRKLGEIMGQSIVIENRPGAGSMISTEYVARAPKDGYTLLLGTIAATINATLSPRQTVNFSKDLEPIVLVSSIPNILVVYPPLGVNSVKDLIALAKAKPDQISYGSAGVGSAPHLSAELFKQMAGVQMTHVPYQGSAQAVTDLIAGRVQVMFSPASTVLAFIKQGTLKALASTESKRTSIAPDLPTMSEAGLTNFETSVWFGILAPAGTPSYVVTKVSRAVNEALKDQEVLKLLHAQGMDALGGSPDEFSRYIASETAKWANVIKTAKIGK